MTAIKESNPNHYRKDAHPASKANGSRFNHHPRSQTCSAALRNLQPKPIRPGTSAGTPKHGRLGSKKQRGVIVKMI